jgi:uncharacterized protein
MNTNFSNIMEATETIVKARQEFLTKVYAWMVGGLLLTGLTSWLIYESGIWIQLAHQPMFIILLFVGELILVSVISSRVETMSVSLAGGLFLLYSLLNGVVLSFIFAIYTKESLQTVFIIAASMFAALSFVGYTTKRDLTGLRKFMLMGLVGLVVTMLISFFVESSLLYFLTSVVGIIVFAGLTVYDTNKLKEMYLVRAEGGLELANKIAIVGALTLYLDFINLLLFLLRLLGNRR